MDASPTGTGKSHADAAALDDALAEAAPGASPPPGRTSLTLLPTHVNCREVVAEYARRGVEAVAFPQLTADTCARYDEAVEIQGYGLPLAQVLCPGCPHRGDCPYRLQLAAAHGSRNAVATHARGAGSMTELTADRAYVSIHENPLGMLRPVLSTLHGLKMVGAVADEAGRACRSDDDRGFYRYLAGVARDLDRQHLAAVRTVVVPLPSPAPHVPERVYRELSRAVVGLGAAPPRDAMRIALGVVLGGLTLLAVTVDERHGPGGGLRPVRSLVGVSRTDLPTGAVVWINDATASRAELGAALGRPVTDMTPRGRLARHHPVVQVIPSRDVTMARGPGAVADLLRGLLHDIPHRRVGLLTHRGLSESVPPLLGGTYRGRLAMVEYFGGGLSRGSNVWTKECEALVVLGTPRPGGDAVRQHLLQLGDVRAAGMGRAESGWGDDSWQGVTETGRPVVVFTRHYHDPAWHASYCSLVRGELVQAVGRGRGILPEGIPVYVVTTENLAPPDGTPEPAGGAVISDRTFTPLTETQARVLDCLYRDVAGSRRRVVALTRVITGRVGLSQQRVSQLLGSLLAAGRVRKVGERGGWCATAQY